MLTRAVRILAVPRMGGLSEPGAVATGSSFGRQISRTHSDPVATAFGSSLQRQTSRSVSDPVATAPASDFHKIKKAEGLTSCLLHFAHRCFRMCLRFCRSPGSPGGITQHRELHRAPSKTHSLTRTRCPNVDVLSADFPARICNKVLAGISRMF
jgi:hypothetical protein